MNFHWKESHLPFNSKKSDWRGFNECTTTCGHAVSLAVIKKYSVNSSQSHRKNKKWIKIQRYVWSRVLLLHMSAGVRNMLHVIRLFYNDVKSVLVIISWTEILDTIKRTTNFFPQQWVMSPKRSDRFYFQLIDIQHQTQSHKMSFWKNPYFRTHSIL